MDDSESGKWVPHGDGKTYTGKGEQSNILTDLEHQSEQFDLPLYSWQVGAFVVFSADK